jgi:disulfide bond formation protein DsbB
VRVYQFRHTGPAHDPEEIVADAARDGAAFPATACAKRHLYIFARWRRPWTPMHLSPAGRGALHGSRQDHHQSYAHRPCIGAPNRQIAAICGNEHRERAPVAAMAISTSMKQGFLDRARTEPAAAAAIAVFVLSLATLAGAWFFEYVLKLAPCPLCLMQRIPYHIIIPLSLLLAIASLVGAPRNLLLVGFAAIAIAAACNVVLGIYHAGVEWHWWAGPADCSGPLTDLRTGGSLLDQLHAVHVVRCDEAAWRFLGLSLAGYNVLISLVLAMIAGFGLNAARLAHGTASRAPAS